MLRIVFTWFLLAVGLASAAVWDLSKWDDWKGNTVLATKVQTWNLWTTDVVPFVNNDWDVFVWDWGSTFTKLEHKLNYGHKLVRFTSFYKPHKWVAAWFNTWWNGKLWDYFYVWEYTNNGWVVNNFDVHGWAALVTGNWTLWNGLEVWNGDNFKLLPVNWTNLVLAGHANKALANAGKWHPNWWWTWQNGAWKVNWLK